MNELTTLSDADLLQMFEENAFFLDDSLHSDGADIDPLDLLVLRDEVKHEQGELEAEIRRRGLTPAL